MYPHERSLVEELKDAPFALIGVNSDKIERAKQAVAKNDLNWRSFRDMSPGNDRPISEDWEVEGWPTLVVLDADMRIHYRGHDGDAAEHAVRELLATM